MSIDERLEALTMNLELLHRDVQDLRVLVDRVVIASQQDGENIRALARIAEIHERRLTHIEGDAT
jgi:ribosomal silencing factor RsfS